MMPTSKERPRDLSYCGALIKNVNAHFSQTYVKNMYISGALRGLNSNHRIQDKVYFLIKSLTYTTNFNIETHNCLKPYAVEHIKHVQNLTKS